MHRDYIRWFSPSLHRDMELLVFGDAGFPVIVFPTSYGRFFEFEDRGMVGTLAPRIERGDLQLICVDSVDLESWFNKNTHPADRLHRQNAFDAYLVNEVCPFIRNREWDGKIGSAGCSFGGYHAINFALRHPDVVAYAVSMSGAFDIPHRFLDGFYNQDAYYHAPLDYMRQLSDAWHLGNMRSNHYALIVGNHDPLVDQNMKLAHEFGIKQIPHRLDVWEGFCHDWPWWQKMAQKFFL